MPQVASALPILSKRPEPAGGPPASNDVHGAFGAMLDASAGEDTPVNGTSSQTTKAQGGDKSKSPEKSAPSTQVAGPAQAAVSDVEPSTAATPAPASGLDIAILAQAVPAPSDGATAPDAKANDAGQQSAKSDQKADASDSATPSPASPDQQAAAVPAASLVAAVISAPDSTPPAVQPDGVSASGIPSIAGGALAQTTALAQGASRVAAATIDAPPASLKPDVARNKPDTAPQTVALTSPAAKPGDDTTAASPGDSTKVPVTSIPSLSVDADGGPEAGSGTLDTADTSGPAPKLNANAATIAGLQSSSTASGSTSDLGKVSTSAEAASVPVDPQAESPKTGDKKVSASKDNGSKAQPGTTKDSLAAGAKPTQPQAAGDERPAAREGAEGNSNAPAAHQAHEQASEHAAATPRVASGVSHTDLPAPISVTQPLTAQIGPNPSALGLTLAAPLASPVQTIFQPAPERGDGNDKSVPVAGLAVEIVSRAEDGLRRFEIRLDPPELGRIDVRLDVDNGGNVTSRLTVDRPETLDLLRRDAPQLERALQHAGLNTEGGLQFSLRDQNFANRDQTPRNTPTFIVADDEAAAADAARRGYGRLVGLGSGVDIRV